MTRQVRYTPSARSDLIDILDYITRESGNRATGRRFVRTLRSRCDVIARFPGEIGTARPEIGQDIRGLPFGNYVIFFRYAARSVEILNFVEGHRDLDAFFGKPS
ncbi:type II toxin-antitoxin system RelE/ParE family toxin [Prosthecomicrobium sp. N25]|uniref:type II toxin-antitoxin system RelE/ParE family toxin n=1 Tax=Prosthecomicrobium sp. N25 TaxID=3129254 RepID=UPI003077C3BF